MAADVMAHEAPTRAPERERVAGAIPAHRWLAQRRAVFDDRRQMFGALLRRAVPAWRWREPDAGLGLWVDLGDIDADRFTAVAARHGVAVVPGTIAGVAGAAASVSPRGR
jgi:DNA-binding transcriptional MocR family regulator